MFAAGRGKKEIVQQLTAFCRSAVGGRLCGVQGACAGPAGCGRHPAGLLSGARSAQVCRHRENHELAVGPGGGGADRGDVQAFTELGIENLIELIRFYKENPGLLRQ